MLFLYWLPLSILSVLLGKLFSNTAVFFNITHQVLLIYIRLNSLCDLDIWKVLHDLKETSLHSVDILKHFVVCW